MPYTPQEVSQILHIAGPTLRAWSAQFAAYLSDVANPPIAQSGKPLHRRYTEADLVILKRIKSLKDSGKTVQQIRNILDQPDQQPPPEDTGQDAGTALVPTRELQLALAAIQAKDQAIAGLQQTIDALQHARDRAEDDADQLRAERAQLVTERELARREAEEKRAEADRLADELIRARSELASAKFQVETLEAAHQMLKSVEHPTDQAAAIGTPPEEIAPEDATPAAAPAPPLGLGTRITRWLAAHRLPR